MKAFLVAVLVLVASSVAASFVLERYQRGVDTAYVGSGAKP